jgi:hypothetical protein
LSPSTYSFTATPEPESLALSQPHNLPDQALVHNISP